MAEKARHAFGQTSSVEAALQAGRIDAYDILFLDGETNPKVGWIDKDGVFRLVANKTQVLRVDELPVADGDPDVVYICNNECYIWNGEECVSMSKPANLTALENQVSNLETELSNKVDAETVETMIQEQAETSDVVIEF